MHLSEQYFPFSEAKAAHVAIFGMPPYVWLETESDYTTALIGDMPRYVSQLPEGCKEELRESIRDWMQIFRGAYILQSNIRLSPDMGLDVHLAVNAMRDTSWERISNPQGRYEKLSKLYELLK